MTTHFRPLRAVAHHKDPLMAAGIGAALAEAPEIEVVTASGHPTLPATDVVICDYESGMSVARGLRHSAAEHASGVIVITWRDAEADVRDALQSGIGGYLLGNCGLDELRDAVRTVGRGAPYLCDVAAARVTKSLTRTPLTPRETEILQLLARGMPNKVVAAALSISVGTVKSHTAAILDKLGARNRTEATVVAAQRGLLRGQLVVPAGRAPRRATTFARQVHDTDAVVA